MLEHLRNLLHSNRSERDERGASAVEYGLLVAGIAALIVAVVFLFGGMIKGVFTDSCSAIQNDDGAPPAPAQQPRRDAQADQLHTRLRPWSAPRTWTTAETHFGTIEGRPAMAQRDERGASAVEYGLLVGGIAAVVVAAVFLFGGTVTDTLFGVSCDTVAGKVSTTTSVEPDCQP